MKCVKEKRTSKIVRVKDKTAQEMVARETHVYTNKQAWKRQEVVV